MKYQPSIKAELAADAKIKLVKNFIFSKLRFLLKSIE